jgi:hypothetical protein
MPTFRALLLAALVVAALPSSAAAKGVTSVKMCGASGCTDVTGEASDLVMQGGTPTDPPSAAAPFYVLRVTIGEPAGGGLKEVTHDELTTLYVPSTGLLRGGDGTWMAPDATRLAQLDGRVGAQDPWPASRLASRAPELATVAAAARPAARETSPATNADDDGFDVPIAAIAAAGAAALLALLAAAVLRRRGPEAQS